VLQNILLLIKTYCRSRWFRWSYLAGVLFEVGLIASQWSMFHEEWIRLISIGGIIRAAIVFVGAFIVSSPVYGLSMSMLLYGPWLLWLKKGSNHA
jgi:hypothetical protein